MHATALALLLLVRTYDVAGVAAGDMSAAREVSRRILHSAGVDVVWRSCPDARTPPGEDTRGCADSPRPDELVLRIISSLERGGSSQEIYTLGYSYVDTGVATGTLATIFEDRVQHVAQDAGVAASTLLGRTMAHEIGHLLLGTNAHQPRGLMRASWSAKVLQRQFDSDWAFSPREAERMRDNLAKRIAAIYQPVSVPFNCSSSQALSGAK